MAKKFSFIHAADIHLGDMLHVGGKLPKEFNNASYKAFENICDFAIKNKVDFILIAGDLFHNKGRSINVDKFFYEQCNRIAPIKIFIICGNHDPLEEKIEIFNKPSNLFYFKGDIAEAKEVYNDGNLICRIIGQSYIKKAEEKRIYINYKSLIKEDGTYNIALLHTQMDNVKSNYVPCSIVELKEIKNINYWALGHIHKASVLNEESPFIGYPGIPQGYDFGEDNSGGFFYVQVDENSYTSIKFIHCSPVILKKVNINISQDKENIPETIDDLEELIIKKSEEVINSNDVLNLPVRENHKEFTKKGYIVKWILTGNGDIHNLLKLKEEDVISYLKESLNNKLCFLEVPIWTEDIDIQTKRIIDNEELEKNSLYKEIKSVKELCFANDEYRKHIIKTFGRIWTNKTEEECDDLEISLNEDKYNEIIEKAFVLIKEKLLESSD
ncbi:metallophosphoesterase family protein [Clostridium lundense]|uniref:metallophosphoesterase family protein n=1 Tax=Clostridium lundense TaxID=319475 RepID=UPI0004828E33|nr:DNA repair exonuclease [Clostridium lundense]